VNLVLVPLFGYLGASTTTVLTEIALCAFGWWFVQRRSPELRLDVVRLSWRIVLAGLVMGVVLYPLARYSIVLSAPAGFVAYLVALLLLRAIEPDEWRLARDSLVARLRPGSAA
jgi:O-antigen/teichoic acid export membrane protein